MTLAKTFIVDGWKIEPQLNRMMRDGLCIRLEPRVMQLLCKLAEQPGEVFTRNDLLDDVWQGVTVGEETLTRAISELRKAFRDDPKHPSVIETIYKAGYRLLAAVEPCEEATTIISGEPKNHNLFQQPWAAVLLAVVLVIAAVPVVSKVNGNFRPEIPESASFKLSPVTTLPGEEVSPALSPNGDRLVFSWRKPGSRYNSLMMKMTASDELVTLLNDGHSHYLSAAWSPDASSLALVQRNAKLCKILRYDFDTRRIITLAHCFPGSLPQVAWHPDGRAIIFSDRENHNAPYRLYRLSIADSSIVPMTSPPTHFVGDRHAAYSPDGKSVAFLRVVATGISDIYVKAANTKEKETQVTFDSVKIRGLAWLNDQNDIIFSSNRRGEWDLWKKNVEIDGVSPISLGANSFGLSFSNDSQRVAFEKRTVDVDIWSVGLGNANLPAKSIIGSSQWDDEPAFSHDGKYVAFASNRSGAPEIWISDANGESPRRLTLFNGGLILHPRWSPDGSSIVFNARTDGNSDIYLVKTDTGAVRRLTSNDANDSFPEWSADGNDIFFSSNRSGEWQIWRLALENTMNLSQVTRDGGFAPRPTQNGVFYMHTDQKGIWFLPRDGGDAENLLQGEANFSPENWAAFEDKIFFVRNTPENRFGLYEFDSASGDINLAHPDLEISESEADHVHMAITPDGETVLFSKIESLHSDIMLLDMVYDENDRLAFRGSIGTD